MKSDQKASTQLLMGIIVAIAVWGLFLGIGAYLGLWYQREDLVGRRDGRRFWAVAGMVATFLAVWGVALALRGARIRADRKREEG